MIKLQSAVSIETRKYRYRYVQAFIIILVQLIRYQSFILLVSAAAAAAIMLVDIMGYQVDNWFTQTYVMQVAITIQREFCF